MRLEASTKPHVHNLIHEFLINIAFTMACPNSKKGLKMVSSPLGVKIALVCYQLSLLLTHVSKKKYPFHFVASWY
jgi:serine protease inhibitor ecotin